MGVIASSTGRLTTTYNCAPGPAHDIADKKNAHAFNLFGYLRSMRSCAKIDYCTFR